MNLVSNQRIFATAKILLSFQELKFIVSFSYAIKIGHDNNTASTIFRLGPSSSDVVFDTPGVLSCDSYTTFWVSWTGREVMFGAGSAVGSNEIGR